MLEVRYLQSYTLFFFSYSASIDIFEMSKIRMRIHPVHFHTHEILEMRNLIYNDKKTQQINVCLGLEPKTVGLLD